MTPGTVGNDKVFGIIEDKSNDLRETHHKMSLANAAMRVLLQGVLDRYHILGCSPKLSHTVDLVAIGYGAHLSSLRSVSFHFTSLLSIQQVLSTQ